MEERVPRECFGTILVIFEDTNHAKGCQAVKQKYSDSFECSNKWEAADLPLVVNGSLSEMMSPSGVAALPAG